MTQKTIPQVFAEVLAKELTRDEVRELIIELDAAVGHWPFTESLAKHFDDLTRVAEIERALDVANSQRPDVGEIKVLQ